MLWTTGRWDMPAESLEPSLTEIMGIFDEACRTEKLHMAIVRLSKDFGFADWQVVEQFAQQLWHLPFSTLDLWLT
jgi:hypothetical protein